MLCFCVFFQSCHRTQIILCHALVIVTLLFPIFSGQHSLPPHQVPVKRRLDLRWRPTQHSVTGRWSRAPWDVTSGLTGVIRSSVSQSAGIENFTGNVLQKNALDNKRSGIRSKTILQATPKIDEFLEIKKLPFTQKSSLGRQKFHASSRRSLNFSHSMHNRRSISAHPYFQPTVSDRRRQKSLQRAPLSKNKLIVDTRIHTHTWKNVKTLVDFDTLFENVSQQDDNSVQRTMNFEEPIAASATLTPRMRRSPPQKSITANLNSDVFPMLRKTRALLPVNTSSSPSQPSTQPEFVMDTMLSDEEAANFSILGDLETNVSTSGNDSWQHNSNCSEWTGGQYTMYQIGNLMCLVAFLVPHNFRASGVLMRSSLAGAMVLFSAWASVKLCALDMLLWYVSLTAVNLVHACRLGYVLWPARITPELTDVYDKLFRPLKVPRVPFMQLAREGRIEMLPAGHIYAEEDITTAATRLSLLLSGRLSVSCDSTHLHYIFPNQFVDSPEWETNRHVEHPTELFQVTVVSDEASVLLVWPREKLLALLHTNDSLSSVILNLVGRDITTKLYSLTEQQEQQRSNSTSMLMPGDRVRPLLRGMASGSGAYGRVSRPSFCHSNQTDPRLTRQILDSLPGSSEKCSSSNVRTAGSNVKKETSSDAGGCNAVRETLGALSHTSPDLLDQTTPSVINGANHEVQSSRDDTQTPHSRHSDGEELASTGRGSNTEGKELSTGIAHNDGVMRLVPYQSSTHFSSPSASSSSHKHVKTDLLHDSYSPSSSLLSDPALVETAV